MGKNIIDTDNELFTELVQDGKADFELSTVILEPGTDVEVCNPRGEIAKAVVVKRIPSGFLNNIYSLKRV